jgi:hypothetical protein
MAGAAKADARMWRRVIMLLSLGRFFGCPLLSQMPGEMQIPLHSILRHCKTLLEESRIRHAAAPMLRRTFAPGIFEQKVSTPRNNGSNATS